MRAVVGGAGLEVGLVLHRAGHPRVVDVDKRRHALARTFLEGIAPLALPCAVQRCRQPGQGLGKQLAVVVLLDFSGVAVEEFFQRRQVGWRQLAFMAGQVAIQLMDPPFGAVEHLLRQCWTGNAAGGIAEVFAQEFRFRQARFAHHVAGGETVHGVSDRDQR